MVPEHGSIRGSWVKGMWSMSVLCLQFFFKLLQNKKLKVGALCPDLDSVLCFISIVTRHVSVGCNQWHLRLDETCYVE